MPLVGEAMHAARAASVCLMVTMSPATAVDAQVAVATSGFGIVALTKTSGSPESGVSTTCG
eukprot:5811297-Prymnesium_polylepis.1